MLNELMIDAQAWQHSPLDGSESAGRQDLEMASGEWVIQINPKESVSKTLTDISFPVFPSVGVFCELSALGDNGLTSHNVMALSRCMTHRAVEPPH